MAMKRKREIQPQLSAFAARKKAAEEEAQRLLLETTQHTSDDLESGSPGVVEVQEDENEDEAAAGNTLESQVSSGSDFETREPNSFAVLAPRNGPAEEVHSSRSRQVAEAEAAARFEPKLVVQKSGIKILGLSAQEKVTVRTSCRFQVIQGCIEILGAQLDSEDDSVWHHLTTSKVDSLPALQAVSDEILDQAYFSFPVVALIAFDLSADDGLIKCLEQYPTGKSSLIASSESDRFNKLEVVPVNSSTISLNHSWLQALSETDKNSGCVVFIGPKSVGKSTLAKLLLNRHLTTEDIEGVYYLDLDPGQPAFSPPGLVSLYYLDSPVFSSSAFDVLQTPLKSHWLGDTSPKDDPEHYLACAAELIESIQRHRVYEEPIIVNTPGWVKGTGLDLLLSITAILDRTFPSELSVISLGNSDYPSSVPFPVRTCDRYSSPTSASATQVPTHHSISAADARTLNVLSYFHRSTPGTWHAGPLTAPDGTQSIWRTPFDAVTIKISREELDPRDLISAINGTIVSIVSVSTDTHASTSDTDVNSPYHAFSNVSGPAPGVVVTAEGLRMYGSHDATLPISPSSSNCLGLAIIYGLDLTTRTIELLSPITAAQLDFAAESTEIVLVTGSIEVPGQLMTFGLPGSGSGKGVSGEGESGVPYVTYRKGEGIGWQNWHVRRNIGRRVRNG